MFTVSEQRETIKMAHTILLVQPGVKLDTRTYTDYESVNECMEVANKAGQASTKFHRVNVNVFIVLALQCVDFSENFQPVNAVSR